MTLASTPVTAIAPAAAVMAPFPARRHRDIRPCCAFLFQLLGLVVLDLQAILVENLFLDLLGPGVRSLFLDVRLLHFADRRRQQSRYPRQSMVHHGVEFQEGRLWRQTDRTSPGYVSVWNSRWCEDNTVLYEPIASVRNEPHTGRARRQLVRTHLHRLE